jgi:hypothetical protein
MFTTDHTKNMCQCKCQGYNNEILQVAFNRISSIVANYSLRNNDLKSQSSVVMTYFRQSNHLCFAVSIWSGWIHRKRFVMTMCDNRILHYWEFRIDFIFTRYIWRILLAFARNPVKHGLLNYNKTDSKFQIM